MCEIPRFWLKGTDLVRHKQDYHKLNNFPAMLSWEVVPDGFQDKDLLEFNVKDFGFLHQRRKWAEEVANYQNTRIHEVIFEHPNRKPETLRKSKVKSKKGASSDILEAGGGGVPVDLSVASTVGVSPDGMVVATVSPKKDDYELKDAYNTIAKLKADVAAANKSLAEKDLKIKDLELQKGVIFDDG